MKQSAYPVSRWKIGALIGVLLLVLVGGALLFGALFDRDHPRIRNFGIPEVALSGISGTAAPLPEGAPFMSAGMTPTLMKSAAGSSMDMSMNVAAMNPADRKTVTKASLDLRVESIDSTVGKVSEIVLGNGGYVGTLNRNQPKDGEHTAWVVVKIPTKDFFSVYENIKNSVYYVTNESLSGEDVTQESEDLAARLKNKQDEENTLQDLLKQATKVEDVIQITDRLTQVRDEIENLQSQERQMDSQTEMSSLSLSMVEDPQITADTGDFRGGNIFKQAVNELTRSLVHIGAGLVVVLVTGIPLILVYLLILWIVYFFTKKGVKRFFDR